MLLKTPKISSFHIIINEQGSVMSTRSGLVHRLKRLGTLRTLTPRGQQSEQSEPLRTLSALFFSWSARILGITLVAVLGSMTPLLADAADMYRWNDSNGNPVLSDRLPPTGTPYTVVDVDRYGGKTNVIKPTTGEASSNSTSMLSDSANLATSQSNISVRVEKRPELCAQASDTVFKLETFARIRTTDANGEVRFMTDSERAEQLKIAQEVAEANC
jgi:hypothetical protein